MEGAGMGDGKGVADADGVSESDIEGSWILD